MARDDKPPFAGDFDDRLKRLREARGERSAAPDPERAPARMRFGSGIQVGIELVAGVAGGCLLGWALDRWLGTAPFLLIVCFFLGAAAGMLNAYRHLRRYSMAASAQDD